MESAMVSTPQNKQALENEIHLAFNKILLDYSTIPETSSRVLGVEGNIKGTEISVSDTLAYLIGWQRLVLKWHKLSVLNQSIDFPETGYKWSELGKLAQSFHHEYRDWTFSDLISEFETTTKDILSLVGSLSEHELYGTVWYKKYTLGKMIQFNTSSPMKNMRAKVRKFKKNKRIS